MEDKKYKELLERLEEARGGDQKHARLSDLT
jgi:hypothetical protein